MINSSLEWLIALWNPDWLSALAVFKKWFFCGMTLEPETVTIGEEDSEELDDIMRRFWICTLLTLPLFIYAMSDMVGVNLDQIGSLDISGQLGQIIQLVLATPVVV